ncbi:MAG TPA: hypothetical protein VFF39_02400, partial [Verrucomicrobiae bacterium]|nr:hypothetical protein [Verrucomicrobiae bacterium]
MWIENLEAQETEEIENRETSCEKISQSGPIIKIPLLPAFLCVSRFFHCISVNALVLNADCRRLIATMHPTYESRF